MRISKHQFREKRNALALHSIAFSCLLAGTIGLTLAEQVQAQGSRFTNAKKTIVPASKFSRHYDQESVSGLSAKADDGSTTENIAPLAPDRRTGALSAGPAAKGDWSTTTKHSYGEPKGGELLAKANGRVQPLLDSGKFDAAQTVMQTYVKNYPHEHSLKMELASISVKNSHQLLQRSSAQAAAEAARIGLAAVPDYQPARDALSQALVKQGVQATDGAERLKIAEGLLAQGKASDAAVEYAESLHLKPSAQGHVGLGDVQLREGHKDKAKSEYQKALQLDSESVAAYRQLGALKYQEGDVVGANSDLSRALVIDPNDKSAASHLIDLWRGQVSHSPNTANSHLGLARAYQLSGDLNAAQSEYRQVVRIEPAHPSLAQARRSFKIALTRQQSQQALESARSLESQGLLKEAHDKAIEAVALYPSSKIVRLYQGQLSQKLGYTAEARAAYNEVLHQDPNDVEAITALRALPPDATPLSDGTSLSSAANAESAGAAVGTAFGAAAGSAAGALSAGGTALLPPIGSQSSVATSDGGPANPVPRPYTTQQHVTSMGSFLGQLRNLAQASQQQSQAAEAASGFPGSSLAMGSAAGVGTSGLLSAAGGSAVQSLSTAPPSFDGSGAQSAISQASAALSAAGTSLSSSSVGGARLTGSAASSTYGGALSTGNASAQAFVNAMRSMPQVSMNVDANVLAAAAQRYAPLLHNDDGTPLTKTQIGSLYRKYHSTLEQQLGVRLPSQLPSGAYSAIQAARAGIPVAPFNTDYVAASRNASPHAMTYTPSSGAATPPVSVQPVVANNAYAEQPPVVLPVAIPAQIASAPPQVAAVAPVAIDAVSSGAGTVATSYGAPTVAAPSTGSLSAASAAMPTEIGLRGPLNKPGLPIAPSEIKAPNNESLRGFMPATTGSTGSNTKSVVTNNSVKLELISVQPGREEMRMTVRLRNSQNVALPVSSGTKAYIQMNGKKHPAKVFFASDNVPANGELQGTIVVSGHDLNASGDLWVPNLLPGSGPERSLHLSVSVPAPTM